MQSRHHDSWRDCIGLHRPPPPAAPASFVYNIGLMIGLGVVSNPHDIETISRLGLILLLFLTRLEIDIKKLKESGVFC